MSATTREQLHAYLDDALGESETARVEQALRDSAPLRDMLREVMQERDRGEHSLGAVWRGERLTCPDRQKLEAYLHEVLDDDEQDYVRFHLQTVGCAFCQANQADLQRAGQEPAPRARERRRRIFETSAGLLQGPET